MPETELSDAAILEKHGKGEELTEAEQLHVMGGEPGVGADGSELTEDEAESLAEDSEEGSSSGAPSSEERGSPPASDEKKDDKTDEKAADTSAADEKATDATSDSGAEKTTPAKTEEAPPKGEPSADVQERGIYHRMQHERRKRQDAERERDVLKLQRIRADQEAKDTELPDDEVVTGKVLKEREADIRANNARELSSLRTVLWEQEAARTHADFHQVLDVNQEWLSEDANFKEQTLAAMKDPANTDNLALMIYDYIKAHPSYIAPKSKEQEPDKPAADEKKEDTPKEEAAQEGKEKAKKLKDNEEKVVTTGASDGGGGGGTTEGVENMTLQQLTALSDDEFAAIPVDKRKLLLAKHGA